MDWRKTVLSAALVGGCIWCLGMVQKAHSEERAIVSEPQRSSLSPQSIVNRGDAETQSTTLQKS